MRKCTLPILILLPILHLYGQNSKPMVEGKISYITTQNIYAKFEQPGTVLAGDTVFFRKDQNFIPLFVAESVSSTSCVGKPLGSFEIKVSDAVFAKARMPEKESNEQATKIVGVGPGSRKDSIQAVKQVMKTFSETSQKVRGRLAVSSYSSFSNTSVFNQRMRYTFSLSANHISDGKFSTDTYIMFTHQLNHWADVQSDIFNALKIYSLSVKYDLNQRTHFLVGRNINPRMASVGAIDGFQAETLVKHFTFGAVVGSNPDYSDYSFNPKLFEYGGYLSYEFKTTIGNLVNSFAFLQQTNAGNIDRRFAYFQHENSLIKNVNLFFSTELDFYSLKNGVASSAPSLTSLYLSINYRMSKKLSVNASYDARKNVIYYETFKNFVDQMLVDATRQGYQFRINYRPVSLISAGVSGGYRFQKGDVHPMLNVNGFLMFAQVPWINATVNLTSNWLQSSYVSGMLYGIRIDRDLIPMKLSGSISYRLADYNYLNTNSKSLQHMPEMEFLWQITRKFSLSANYDGTFEKSNQYNSIYINLIKRF